MKVYGIELSDLRQWEVEALNPSIQLLRDALSRVWTDKNTSERKKRQGVHVIENAWAYLRNLHPNNNKNQRSFARDKSFPVKKDEAGNRLCRWCQKPVPRKRMSYCSDECLKEVDCRTNAGALRRHVFLRDQGVCAGCGCDTEKIKRVADYAGTSLKNCEHYGRRITRGRLGWWTTEVWRIYISMGFNGCSSHVWEADHIKELSAGGESSLENTQTLCIPCHKAKTKQMHAERKFERTGIRPKPPVKESQLGLL